MLFNFHMHDDTNDSYTSDLLQFVNLSTRLYKSSIFPPKKYSKWNLTVCVCVCVFIYSESKHWKHTKQCNINTYTICSHGNFNIFTKDGQRNIDVSYSSWVYVIYGIKSSVQILWYSQPLAGNTEKRITASHSRQDSWL
jgi:hypothetical protein